MMHIAMDDRENYFVSNEIEQIARKLIGSDFNHLAEARFTCYLDVNGKKNVESSKDWGKVIFYPELVRTEMDQDFAIVLLDQIWNSKNMLPEMKEVCIFHLLCSITKDDKGVFKKAKPDFDGYYRELKKYGSKGRLELQKALNAVEQLQMKFEEQETGESQLLLKEGEKTKALEAPESLPLLGVKGFVLPECFKLLGFDILPTVEELETKFRELVKQAHPDAGGSDEAFRSIVAAKAEAATYLQGAIN